MRKTVALLFTAMGVAAAGVATTGCSTSVVEFSARVALGEGVRGRVWRPVEYVEVNATTPAADTDLRTHLAFDLASDGGSKAFMAASLFEGPAATGKFKGYSRSWSETSGWAAIGAEFSPIAVSGAGSVIEPSIAMGPGETLLSLFFLPGASSPLSVRFQASWDPQVSEVGVSNQVDFVDTDKLGAALFVTTVFDKLGRAYTFLEDLNAGAVAMNLWEPAGGMTNSGYSVVPASRHIGAVYDGDRTVCGFFTGDAAAPDCVGAQCMLTACMDTVIDSIPTSERVSTGSGMGAVGIGSAIATDGVGAMAIVYYQEYSSKMHAIARLGEAGDWDDRVVLSEAMPTTEAVMADATDGIAPGVVSLGSGRWLVVWPAVDATALTTKLYYRTYDPDDGWGALAQLGETESYRSRPHVQSLHLFSNGDSNAGIAVNWTAESDSTDPDTEDYDKHYVWIARYHWQNGWLEGALRGNGCKPGAGGILAGCTRRPVGAILPSGATVVLFQDMDSAGRFRLGSVGFTK